MRRPAMDPRAALAAAACALAACAAWGRGDAAAFAAACPRDAARDASGRCACADGTLPLLGACVPPRVGDAFCGPAAVLEPDGCAFRRCGAGEDLDVATGRCAYGLAAAPVEAPPSSGACADAGSPVVEDGRAACAPPDATCPRGSRRDPAARACVRPPPCPPGTLPEGRACRPVVMAGGELDGRRVDVGAWAAIVLGADGGPGSPELCRPLEVHAVALGAAPGDPLDVGVTVVLSIPDQDVSRVVADARLDRRRGPAPPAGLEELVSSDVGTLVEALRALGGEATAAAVSLRVRCRLGG